MAPAVYWILSWQDNKPWQCSSYCFYRCLCSWWEIEILNTWHFFVVVHIGPDIVQIKSSPLHIWWKRASYQTSSLSVQLALTISLWDDLVCAVLFDTQLHPVCPSSGGLLSSRCSSWVSFGTSGYPFAAPISLTHVQVQYWLALSSDNISI